MAASSRSEASESPLRRRSGADSESRLSRRAPLKHSTSRQPARRRAASPLTSGRRRSHLDRHPDRILHGTRTEVQQALQEAVGDLESACDDGSSSCCARWLASDVGSEANELATARQDAMSVADTAGRSRSMDDLGRGRGGKFRSPMSASSRCQRFLEVIWPPALADPALGSPPTRLSRAARKLSARFLQKRKQRACPDRQARVDSLVSVFPVIVDLPLSKVAEVWARGIHSLAGLGPSPQLQITPFAPRSAENPVDFWLQEWNARSRTRCRSPGRSLESRPCATEGSHSEPQSPKVSRSFDGGVAQLVRAAAS